MTTACGRRRGRGRLWREFSPLFARVEEIRGVWTARRFGREAVKGEPSGGKVGQLIFLREGCCDRSFASEDLTGTFACATNSMCKRRSNGEVIIIINSECVRVNGRREETYGTNRCGLREFCSLEVCHWHLGTLRPRMGLAMTGEA